VSPRRPSRVVSNESISSQESAFPMGNRLVSAMRRSDRTLSTGSSQKHVSFSASVSVEERDCDSDADDEVAVSKQPVYII
jgi:hypothetical protein